MRIRNITRNWRLTPDASWLQRLVPLWRELQADQLYPLRYAVVAVTGNEATIEISVVDFADDNQWRSHFTFEPLLNPTPRRHAPGRRFCVAQIVPTGIKCSLGGYAGDATPVTRLLASCCDVVLTHPNAVNASDINEKSDNTLYVEGKTLDDFMLGELGLEQSITPNCIGTVIDPTGRDYLDEIIHVLNAGMAVGGFDCESYSLPSEDLGVSIEWTATGCASGTINNPDALLKTVQSMLDRRIDAIGVVSVIHGVSKEMCEKHIAGDIPNPSGAVEAIITHLLSKVFRVPTAHAPLPYYLDVKHPSVENPRSSAEYISTPHYFSVLKGLHDAPRIVDSSHARSETLTVNDIGAVVAPASALGGVPVLAAELHGIPIIAVAQNQTILQVDQRVMKLPNVIEVESYLEAAGVIAALRSGINLNSLRRPLHRARELS